MATIINDEALELVPVGALTAHPQNPNRGDVGAIAESIAAHGFYGALIVQRSTGYVLAGTHRLEAARRVGLAEVPALYVDVDDRRALKILLADNRTAELAARDAGELAKLLDALAADDDLLGTGYDDDDLAQLLDFMQHPDDDMWSDAFGALSQAEPTSRTMSFVFDADQVSRVQAALEAIQSARALSRSEALVFALEEAA